MSTKKIPGDPYFMISEGKRRGVTTDRILAALRKFAQNIRSITDLDIVCLFLNVIGTRRDLDMLDNTQLPDTNDLVQAASLKEGARYLVRRRSLS